MADTSLYPIDIASGRPSSHQSSYRDDGDDDDHNDRTHFATITRQSAVKHASSSTAAPLTFRVGDTVYCDIDESRPRVAVILDIFTTSHAVDLENPDEVDEGVPCFTARLFFWPGAHGLLEKPQRESLESIVYGVEEDDQQVEVFYPHMGSFTRRNRGSRTTMARSEMDEVINAGIQVTLRSSRLLQKVALWTDKEAFRVARESTSPSRHAMLEPDLLCKLAFDSQYGLLWDIDWSDVLNTGKDHGYWWVRNKDAAGWERTQVPGQTAALYCKEYWTKHWASKDPSFITGGKVRSPKMVKKAPLRRRKTVASVVIPTTPRRGQRVQRSHTPDEESDDDEGSASEASSFVDSDDASSEDEMSSATSAAGDDSDDERPHRAQGKRKAGLRTPSKRKATKTSAASTPGKLRAQRMLQTLALPARPPKISSLSSEELSSLTPHERAKRLLHVGSTPEHLPCREAEFAEILTLVEDSIEEGQGGCVYVAGVPGTGKTATVREVVRTLRTRSAEGKLCRFNFVEINGMKLPDASQAYTELWHTISGQRQSPKTALSGLSAHFARKGVGNARPPTVVLMDELDQLVTGRQDVMYNMFEWPKLLGSRLIVIAVANTMDLPERILSARVQSRLGLERVPFEPYNHQQLLRIVRVRLGIQDPDAPTPPPVDEEEGGTKSPERAAAARDRIATAGCDALFVPSALEFVAKRIANLSGDARRMLDVCRLAIEASEARTLAHARGGSAHPAPAAPRPIAAPDVANLFKALTKSGTVAHICALSLHAKLLLFSLLALVRRSGLREAQWDDVLAHHASLCKQNAFTARLAGTPAALYSPDALAVPLAQLCALGLVTAVGTRCGPARASGLARVMLECKESDLRLAFQEDKDARVRGLL